MAIRVSRHVQLDASNLEAHLHDFAKVLGKDLGEVVRDQAGLFCMDLAKYTGPFTGPGKGIESGAKKKGEENVRKAVFKIFQPVEKATKEQVTAINRFDVFKLWTKSHGEQTVGKSKMKQWESFKQKYPASKAVLFIDSGDSTAMSRVHQKHRTFGGKGGLQPYAKKAKSAFAIVPKEKDIERYMRLKQKDIGSLKSGYWFAAQKIRAKDVKAPAWMKHSEGQKYAIGIDQIKQIMKPEVTVGNNVGFRAMPRGLLKAAINYRMYAMRVKMAAELNKKAIPLWSASASGLTTNTSKFF
jgi:hypothetical protein